MSHQDWLPTSWLPHRDTDDAALVPLREQVNSLFDDLDHSFWVRAADFTVRSNVSETDKEVCITAELPGLTEEDVDVSVVGNRITVEGEKKSESEEKNEDVGRQLAAGQIHWQVALLPVRHPALRLCRCCARVLQSPRSDGCP